MNLLLVGAGGAAGAIARYLLGNLVQARTGGPFPYGTLAVNVAGCLVMGILAGMAEVTGLMTPRMRALLVVGLLGGFTTFSAFGQEAVDLVRFREPARAALYVVSSVGLGFLAAWGGRVLALFATGERG